MVRNIVSIGWLLMMSRARSSICLSPGGLKRRLADAATRIAELPDHPVHQIAAWGLRISQLVFEIQGLPLEFTHLVERLHLDPFDVLHRRHESGDSLDVGGIVGLARNQREANPDRL